MVGVGEGAGCRERGCQKAHPFVIWCLTQVSHSGGCGSVKCPCAQGVCEVLLGRAVGGSSILAF